MPKVTKLKRSEVLAPVKLVEELDPISETKLYVDELKARIELVLAGARFSFLVWVSGVMVRTLVELKSVVPTIWETLFAVFRWK